MNTECSLDNSYSKEDLIEWEKRVQKVLGSSTRIYLQLKYDGHQLALLMNGSLQEPLLGDGFQGMIFK
jgi:DNA ligase (NAD+)